MVSSSKIESLAQRFTPYIDELHDFFSSRKVPFGTISDLQAFPGRLRDPAFHEEMVSMVRSILYREGEAVPRTELMDMLAIAVAGPHFDEAAPELHEPLHQILTFVTEVVRSQRVTLPPELSIDDDQPATPALAPAAPTAPLNLVIPPTPDLHPPATPDHTPRTVPLPTNDRLSRALIDSEPNVEAGATPQSRASIPAPPPPTPVRPRPSANSRRSPGSLWAFLRQAYWIPGVCVLLLVVAVAYYLTSRSHPQTAAAPEPTTAVANPELPKPSAYGPTIGASRSHGQHSSSPANGPVPTPGSFAPGQPGNRSSADGRLPSRSITNPPSAGSARHTDLRPAVTSSTVSPRVLGGREGVFLASSGMMAAHLLTAPAPHYPKLASITHVEGEVIVQVVVARDGRVEATRVLEGPRLLRSAAEHAIRHWRYRPYIVDGKPTDVATIVTVNFRLSR